VEVVLRPETMGKSALFGTLDEVIQLSREVAGVLPCVDFAHLHARAGDGSFNSYEEFVEALKRVAAGLGPRGLQDLHIHVSGIAYTCKGERHHLNLKEADLRYEELLQALDRPGSAGPSALREPQLRRRRPLCCRPPTGGSWRKHPASYERKPAERRLLCSASNGEKSRTGSFGRAPPGLFLPESHPTLTSGSTGRRSGPPSLGRTSD
jgi:hypothetical protein